MKDKEFNLLMRRIKKIKNKWHRLLGLRWWTITYYYEGEKCEDAIEKGSSIGAQADVQYPYKTAQIHFYLCDLKHLDDDELEGVVIHEMVHVLVNEMRWYDKDTNHEERVVSDLTSAFKWVYNK